MGCGKSESFLSCLLPFRFQVGDPPGAGGRLYRGGKDGTEFMSLPFKNLSLSCRAFLFLSCLIEYTSVYSSLLGSPASRMKATSRNQAEDGPSTCGASAVDVIKIHG